MNTKRLGVVTVVSGILALAIVFGLYKHNQSAHDAYVNNKHAFQYLAAAKDIPDGNRIGPTDVMAVNWTSDQPVVGAFSVADKAKVIGRIVSYPVANGMLITEQYLAGPDSALGLPHKIPAGMRAIAIRTDDVNDLGGFLYPGVKVDILAAIKSNTDGKVRSQAIVQNVTVLSTGKQINPDPAGKPATVSVVSVLVTPDQAQKIALAEQEGSLYFALRNGGDDQVLAEKATTFPDNSSPAPEPVAQKRRPLAMVPPFMPAGTVVQTILGDKTQSQTFRNNVPVNASFSPEPLPTAGQNPSGAQQ